MKVEPYTRRGLMSRQRYGDISPQTLKKMFCVANARVSLVVVK
jgi:hypothetical protein